MKRLSYITNAFGMNVVELNPGGYTSLARFFAASVPLTLFTIWIIVAFQNRFVQRHYRGGIWKLLWPIMFLKTLIPGSSKKNDTHYDIPLRRQ